MFLLIQNINKDVSDPFTPSLVIIDFTPCVCFRLNFNIVVSGNNTSF